MNVNVSCQCGKELSVPDKFAGKKIKCTACGSLLIVPKDEEVEEVIEEEAEVEEQEEERVPQKAKEKAPKDKKSKSEISVNDDAGDDDEDRKKVKSKKRDDSAGGKKAKPKKSLPTKNPRATLLIASLCLGLIAVIGFIFSGVLLILAD